MISTLKGILGSLVCLMSRSASRAENAQGYLSSKESFVAHAPTNPSFLDTREEVAKGTQPWGYEQGPDLSIGLPDISIVTDTQANGGHPSLHPERNRSHYVTEFWIFKGSIFSVNWVLEGSMQFDYWTDDGAL